MQHMLHNIEYNMDSCMRHPNQRKHNKITDLPHQKTKWAVFTYKEKETKKIRKLFIETQLQIAFRRGSTIKIIVKFHLHIHKHEKNCVYQMIYPLKYTEQKGRTFYAIYIKSSYMQLGIMIATQDFRITDKGFA
jgi:hypothetical protein